MGGKGSVHYLFLSLSHGAPHCLFYTSLSITLREVNVGLSLLESLQHDCHAQPHLNTMKPQLHLIIDMVR